MKRLLIVVCLILCIKANVYVKVGDYACMDNGYFLTCWDDRIVQG